MNPAIAVDEIFLQQIFGEESFCDIETKKNCKSANSSVSSQPKKMLRPELPTLHRLQDCADDIFGIKLFKNYVSDNFSICIDVKLLNHQIV
jgi:hypothetical protein